MRVAQWKPACNVLSFPHLSVQPNSLLFGVNLVCVFSVSSLSVVGCRWLPLVVGGCHGVYLMSVQCLSNVYLMSYNVSDPHCIEWF